MDLIAEVSKWIFALFTIFVLGIISKLIAFIFMFGWNLF